MRKTIDVLIFARPDHSFSIYKELNEQTDLSFLYCSFSLFSKKLSFLHYKKARYVDGNAKIFVWFSLLHTLYYKLGWTKHFYESEVYTRCARRIINKYEPRIIHYWADYCFGLIKEYKNKHPEVITIADVYLPNPIFISKVMKGVYERYGLTYDNLPILDYAAHISERFDGSDYLSVPSRFVEHTMRESFPDKDYIFTSYGITKPADYTPRELPDSISRFIYVGQVSLEKGVDIILEYFKVHPEFSLDLYGNISSKQKVIIYEPYKDCTNIIFHGAVTKQELQNAFKKADIGLHMSRYDAYSLAVSEQIGSGLPVIVSENTGNASDIEEYKLGLVAKLDNEESLANCIQQMTEMSTYSAFLKNIDNVLSNRSISSYPEKMLINYKRLLNNGSF